MLGSLLKYDFRALNKIMLPLQLGVLAAGILGTFCFGFFSRGITSGMGFYSSSEGVGYALAIFAYLLSLLAATVLLSLVYLSGFITLLLVARHVYKNFYSSEGYLTFTLPVSVDTHLVAKIISGMTWLLINVLLIIVVTTFLLMFGFATEGLVNYGALESFRSFAMEFATPFGALYVIELVFIGIIGLIASVLQVIFSVVLGGALARTHKVLAAIGVYLLSGIAMSFISSVFSAIGMVSLNSYGIIDSSAATWISASQPMLLLTLAVYIGFAVGFYLLSRVSLKRSLNLD